MTDETLSTELPYAEARENTPGVPTAVVTWDVPDGTTLTLTEGHAAILEAAAKAGGNVSRKTRLGFGYREPNDPLGQYRAISDFSVAPFNTLSLKDQQSGENAQRRRVNFDPERVPGGRVTVEDADELALLVKGPDVVDPDALFFNYPITVSND